MPIAYVLRGKPALSKEALAAGESIAANIAIYCDSAIYCDKMTVVCMLPEKKPWLDVLDFKKAAEVTMHHDSNPQEKYQRFTRLVGQLSASLLNPEADEIDGVIREALKRIARFLGATQGHLLQFDAQDEGCLNYTLSWLEAGETPPPQQVWVNDLPWIFERLNQHGILWLPSREELPEDAASDREHMMKLGVKSHLSISLKAAQKPIGLLELGSSRSDHIWSKDLIDQINIIANIISDACLRKEKTEAFENQLLFERLISEISRKFVDLSADKVDEEIRQVLRLIAEFLDVDLASLYQINLEEETIYVTHYWIRAGIDVRVDLSERRIGVRDFPWWGARMQKGETVSLRCVDELRAEAPIDIRNYEQMVGGKSNLSVPLMIGGKLIGALTIDTILKETRWQNEYVKRLKVLGEILANAVARKHAEEKLKKSYAKINRLNERLQGEVTYFREETRIQHDFRGIIGQSNALKLLLHQIEQIAPTDTTVLILGESGTGKELTARAVHDRSLRRDRAMVKVSCAALPGALIDSELFGHEKGAFTGAHRKHMGRFEVADGATLFLDEIGELPLELQGKLLRALEDGEFEQLGSSRTSKVDVRVIAATNRDLEKEVESGRFRSDLWYRLNVFPLQIPPLRERKEDIPLLVNWFVNKCGRKLGKNITRVPQEHLDRLRTYHWPGNIRELENTIERAVISSPGNSLKLMDMLGSPEAGQRKENLNRTLAEIEREYIMRVLEKTRWRVYGPNGAALILGLKPSTLRFRMKKLGIQKPIP
jgi:transcriptional regulator with GAF, ATPase, and Fis domain